MPQKPRSGASSAGSGMNSGQPTSNPISNADGIDTANAEHTDSAHHRSAYRHRRSRRVARVRRVHRALRIAAAVGCPYCSPSPCAPACRPRIIVRPPAWLAIPRPHSPTEPAACPLGGASLGRGVIASGEEGVPQSVRFKAARRTGCVVRMENGEPRWTTGVESPDIAGVLLAVAVSAANMQDSRASIARFRPFRHCPPDAGHR